MCGINGVIFKNSPADLKKILTMNELLNHRGPDQSGYIKHKNLLLGHTRLSIIDTSEKGFQPMTTDGRFWIIYNGEVYNYKDIKKELTLKNYKFYSDTDTEVVLNAYKEWGVDCFEKFNGEWALAILDNKKDTLIVCRDGIGYKPCYIFENENYFAFSSEIKGFSPIENLEFNSSNLGINYSTLQSTCTTVYKNINILPHGRVLKINLNNYDKSYKRWDFPLKTLPKINTGYKENVDEFYSLLYQSTKLRLNSDVKVGTSLSGGLDSSAIFTLLNIIEKNEFEINKNLDLNPIILNYEEMKTKDLAVDLVKSFKKDFKILEFNDHNFDEVQNLLVSLETTQEYFMQQSLYKSQSNKGIRVSIDGHGADEFLFYPDWIPQVSIGVLNNIVNLYKTIVKFGKTKSINQFKNIFGLREIIPNKIDFIANPDCNNYFNDYLEVTNFKPAFHYIDEDLEDLENFSYEQSYGYLMAYCGWFQFFLNKWDRAAMSNSVEVRMPFLDKNLRLFNLSLPSNVKYRNGITKSLLRDAFKNYFPKKLIEQNFKQGLKKQKFHFNKNHKNYILEVFGQNNFKNISFFNHKKISDDLSNDINLKTLWELCKNYLILTGFNDNYKNINLPKEKVNTYNQLNN